MRPLLLAASMAALLNASPSPAADIDAHVILSTEVRPGVYGRVEIGHAPPPPVVYARPVIIAAPPRAVPPPPIYLHVPPGHAKHWSKHCRKYNACDRPVYFVKSAEYEPKKGKKPKKWKD